MSFNSLQDGDTPLHLSASNGYISVMEILIKHGADVSIRNKVIINKEKSRIMIVHFDIDLVMRYYEYHYNYLVPFWKAHCTQIYCKNCHFASYVISASITGILSYYTAPVQLLSAIYFNIVIIYNATIFYYTFWCFSPHYYCINLTSRMAPLLS